MATAKKATDTAALSFQVDLSFESLMALFSEIGQGVTRQLEAGTVEERSLAESDTKDAAMRALTEGEETEIVRRRDQIIELLFAIEERAKRIRKTVKNAEELARRYEAFGRNLERSVELGMIEMNLQRIEGEIHRFALHKAPDRLEITDEASIPEEYFDEVPATKVLNRDRLKTALESGKECSGAYLETNRKYLNVK